MSGYLQKLHKGKKWKKMWFVLKDKVLYQFKATQVIHNFTIYGPPCEKTCLWGFRQSEL